MVPETVCSRVNHIITFTMKFPIASTNIFDYLPWHFNAPADDAGTAPRENANPIVSLDDPQREPTAIQHGC
jgi:hypothetical protein